MLFTSLLVLFFSQLFHFAHAANWYTVEWDAPKFTALSGDLVVPKLPQAGGTPYVWPGLQSGNGVLQAVLDGRKGAWWIGDGFYGTPSLPWAGEQQRVDLTMNRAILAVELTNVPFNFGPVIYRNLKITATTAASGWCGKTVSLGYSTGQYTVTGATASGNTCSVSQVTMPSHS
ncbi:hypothetical protein FRC16_009216 [Serendipita sp. 398]|nr:hypothetical protein FRC16_009216 [Serendipita sp. 398]